MNNQKNVNKKPLKFNFNVIDMLIVLIIVAALFFVIYCVVLGNNISDLGAKDADVEYSVIISMIPKKPRPLQSGDRWLHSPVCHYHGRHTGRTVYLPFSILMRSLVCLRHGLAVFCADWTTGDPAGRFRKRV